MTRALGLMIAILLALAFAGCGKDDKPGSTTGAATTETTPDGAQGAGGGAADSDAGDADSDAPAGRTTTSAGRATTTPGRTTTSAASGTLIPGSSTSRRRTTTTTTTTTTPARDTAPRPAGRPGNEPPSVSQVVLVAFRRFEDAIISGDGDRICGAITARARRDIVGSSSRTCAQIAQNDPASGTERSGADAEDVAVDGSVATIELGGGRRVKLLFEGDRWLVDEELV